ncbi:phosphate transporter [Gigaspora margarita]|uniref:Phosphate transporter n=1 Tax=Gigaspora margarita TaxID=4874 RepID=A0A8H4A955_GIGMA|nr:phosphate transporter [Gigaspora margarita]
MIDFTYDNSYFINLCLKVATQSELLSVNSVLVYWLISWVVEGSYVWCTLLGIGIDDDYPLSAIAVAFHSAITTTYYTSIDYIWSIATGNGTISAFIAIYYRLTVPESQRYTIDIERSINKSATNKSTTDMFTT